MKEASPEYVAARRTLLDALTALDGHLENLILVGAQAVYQHTGDADVNVPLMTTDADLAINTDRLSDVPEIGTVLRGAGFAPGPNPGHWVGASDVAIDLMVVPYQSGTTKSSARSARLAPHDKLTARIARGLEPSLLDHKLVAINSLEVADSRTFNLRVAGPAALLTAKLIKIGERLNQADRQPNRLKEKDALDAFRILQAVDSTVLALGFEHHKDNQHAAAVTDEALSLLRQHGSRPEGRIAALAATGAQSDPTIAPAFAALAAELLATL